LTEDFMKLHRAWLAIICAAPFALVSPSRGWSQSQSPEPKIAEPELRPRDVVSSFNPRRTRVVDVVERIKGAVVNIHSQRTVRSHGADDLFTLTPSQGRVNGMGSGIIIDPRGYIVTNYHVIDDVSAIRVRLGDRSAYTATIVARDNEADLALLKIDAARPLPIMPLGTSSDLLVGETVLAVGNAYGYEHTVTAGIVSAIKRDVNLNKELSYRDLIQTDASINPGNSGGPLVNINGELIGVNVAIRAGAQGIGFAIPVDTMVRVVADMMSIRKRNGTWHGLACRDRLEPAGPGLARRVVVDRVDTAGPASRAGLRPGDVIVQVGNVPVASTIDVERGMLDKAAGERVPVIVRRAGVEKRSELVLQTADRSFPAAAEMVWTKLGLRLSPVNADAVASIHGKLHGGLAVAAVNRDSLAAKAGMQQGDILVGLHHWETLTVDNIAFVLNHPDLASFQPLCFYIIRSGQLRRGWFPQGE
jgi:serine protease Do